MGALILFLDFDGVLHPAEVYRLKNKGIVLQAEGALFMHAPVLEGILDYLDPHAQVRIVLSTSWVRVLGYSRTLKRLPSGLRSRVIGATWHSEMKRNAVHLPYWPSDGDPFNSLTRWQQIEWYVTRHQVGHWLAIDDDDYGWPQRMKHRLVHTFGDDGLGSHKAQEDLHQKLKKVIASGV